MPNVNPLIFEKRCIIIVFLLDDLYRQEYMAFWSILEKGRLAKKCPRKCCGSIPKPLAKSGQKTELGLSVYILIKKISVSSLFCQD